MYRSQRCKYERNGILSLEELETLAGASGIFMLKEQCVRHIHPSVHLTCSTRLRTEICKSYRL